MCARGAPPAKNKKNPHTRATRGTRPGTLVARLNSEIRATAMQDETWESHAYRCPICMQIFSEECNSNMTPLILCMHMHTVCRGCCNTIKEQQRSGEPTCPQCRVEMWKHEVVNREKIYFLDKCLLVCGSCDNTTPMSCATARQHSRECVENHITCPLLNNDVVLSRCVQGMNISALWEHCQKFHVQEGSPPTMLVKAQKSDNSNNGDLTASMSFAVNFEKNNYFFFTVTTDNKSYNLCLHVTKEMPRDSHNHNHHAYRDSAATDNSHENTTMFFIVRRFFPELELTFGTMLLSIEVGPVCGMLLRVPSVVSSYEDTTSLKDMPLHDRCQRIVQVPISMLRQMTIPSNSAAAAANSTSAPPVGNLKMMLSLQLYFTECVPAPPPTLHTGA